MRLSRRGSSPRMAWGVARVAQQRGLGRCLVLGAGLIGSHVARRLADAGAAVTVFSRGLNPWFDEGRREGIEVHLGEVGVDDEALAERITEADVVVHLASASRPPIAAELPASDAQDTILHALTVMRLVCAASHRPRLLLASSGGTVYGDPLELPTRETHPLSPRTPHGISNVAVEQYARFYIERHDVRCTVLRFANVYGPGGLGRGAQGVIATWLRQIALGETPLLLASPDMKRDYLYVDDAADAVLAVLERGRADVYNIGSATSVSLRELITILGRVSGYRPDFATKLNSRGGHATEHVTATQLDTGRLRDHTGWVPRVDLERGVGMTWAWIKATLAAETPTLVEGGSA
ncbi:MAG: NAD-dependent epimerase/dehydratase family protein [Gaiellaceae bacterium]